MSVCYVVLDEIGLTAFVLVLKKDVTTACTFLEHHLHRLTNL